MEAQRGRDGCPCVWQLSSAQGLCLGSSGTECSVSWHKELEQPFWLRAEKGNPLVCFASNLCLAASFLKELNAAKLVSLTASSVVYLAVK